MNKNEERAIQRENDFLNIVKEEFENGYSVESVAITIYDLRLFGIDNLDDALQKAQELAWEQSEE